MSRPVALALLATGCFHYAPMSADAIPRPGTEIRATLATPKPFDFGEYTLNDVSAVEGQVTESGPDSLSLLIKWLRPRAGDRHFGNLASFYIDRRDITGLEEWRLSPVRTVGATGIVGALVVGLFVLVDLVGRGNDAARPPGSRQ